MNIHRHHDHSIKAKRLGEDLLRTARAFANVPLDEGIEEGCPWSNAWHAREDALYRYLEHVRNLPGGLNDGASAGVDAFDF